MLDVHVIIHPHTYHRWVSQCLESIGLAMVNAGYQVHVHHAPYIAGHIGKSRKIGYAMGSQPYVTCVDDDDWLEPNAFACLLPPMQDGHAAIYTREVGWQNGKPTQPDLRQHLRVFRRDVVEGVDLDQWPAMDSTALIAHADTLGDSVELPDRVYNYRLRPKSSAKHIAYSTPGLMQRGRALGDVHGVRNG